MHGVCMIMLHGSGQVHANIIRVITNFIPALATAQRKVKSVHDSKSSYK